MENSNSQNDSLDVDLIPEQLQKNIRALKRLQLLNQVKFFFLFLIAVALIFKLQHWKFGSEMLIVGCCSVSCIYVLEFFLAPEKTIGNGIRLIGFALLWVGILFRMMHWNGNEVMVWIGGGVVVAGYFLQAIQKK